MLKVGPNAQYKQELHDPDGKDVIKMIIIGSSKSGKSALLERYISDTFVVEHKATIGVELYVKQTNILEERAVLHLWSFGGHRRLRPLLHGHYERTMGAMIVFDVTSEDSFTDTQFWHNEIRRTCPEAVVHLVGTKNDRQDNIKITEEMIKKQAMAWGAKYSVVSSSLGKGVRDLFRTFITNVAETKRKTM